MTTDRRELARSPLTDPRSLAVSLAINGALLVAASLLALGAVLPREEVPEPRVLRGEFGPTDNRADPEPGGAPGEFGGEGVELSSERRPPSGPTRDAAADALLAEILPARPAADLSPRALPGPTTSGLGLISGPGAGGGGGPGMPGKGRGSGPGAEFFGLRDRAGSYAYVIDCSGSMATRPRGGAGGGGTILDIAKAELLASLDPLAPDTKFGVIFYNLSPTVFLDAAGRKDLMTASPGNKARVRAKLDEVFAIEGTDHMSALRAALAMRPEVIFFLTDADFMNRPDADEIRREAGRTRILAVEFGIGPSIRGSEPLRWLAESTGGSYKYIDVRNAGPRPR